jgi:hypothetical protein
MRRTKRAACGSIPAAIAAGRCHRRADDHHLSETEFPLEGATPIPATAGDAIFFSYLLAHGSGLNRSDEPRTTLLVQLRDPADPPLREGHGSRGQGMMLAGVDPTAGDFRFAWERTAA